MARIKKSLFDIIRLRVPDSRFLDLYCGTGPVGTEALSRGARSATFIERDPQCVRLLRENLETLKFSERASIHMLDATDTHSMITGPFDLIFMGPPYKDDEKKPLALVGPTLANIHRHHLFAPGGLIIAQHHKKELIELPGETWAVKRQETYGDSVLTFIGESV